MRETVFQDVNVQETAAIVKEEDAQYDIDIGSDYGFENYEEDPYGFGTRKEASGIGKRAPYGFGIGKRHHSFSMNKREPYSFGIGKRGFLNGIWKREPYSFGIGKREPYSFGIGKRAPYHLTRT